MWILSLLSSAYSRKNTNFNKNMWTSKKKREKLCNHIVFYMQKVLIRNFLKTNKAKYLDIKKQLTCSPGPTSCSPLLSSNHFNLLLEGDVIAFHLPPSPELLISTTRKLTRNGLDDIVRATKFHFSRKWGGGISPVSSWVRHNSIIVTNW